MHQNSSFIDKNKIIRVKKSISDDCLIGEIHVYDDRKIKICLINQ